MDGEPNLTWKKDRPHMSRRAAVAAGAGALVGAAAVGVGADKKAQSIISGLGKSNHSPSTPESRTLPVELRPQDLVAGQKDGNFDAIRTHQEDPFIEESRDGKTKISEDPEVAAVRMTTFESHITLRRKTSEHATEGERTFTAKDPEFNTLFDKDFAVIRYLGGEYGNKNEGHLSIENNDITGGAWYAFVGAEMNPEGKLAYYFINPLTHARLSEGEQPYFFSASFGNPMPQEGQPAA